MRITTSRNRYSPNDEAAFGFWRWCKFLVFLAVSFNLLGCAAAYNSRHDIAPDDRHSVCCYIRGAFGRNYYDETYKKILVSIYSRGPNDKMLLERDLQEQRMSGVYVSHPIPGLEMKVIFEKEYRLKGSDLSWRSVWSPQNSLSIVFYDSGPGAAIPYSSQEITPKRLLRTINYSFDSNTGNYKEETDGIK